MNYNTKSKTLKIDTQILNFILATILFLLISISYFIQYKTNSIRENISTAEHEINTYQDKIKLLDVEWVYLTRPERIRKLSENYIKENSFITASQMQKSESIGNYYLVNYKSSIQDEESNKNKAI